MATDCLAPNLITHAWNADHTQIAVAVNTDEVWIYETKGSDDPSTWTKIHTLDEHDSFVSGIDWCHETNTLLTCGHDRNAYVWDYEDGKWNPALVILRNSRAATSCKWSPDGKKFAVTSGAKCVPVCKYHEEQDFWHSTLIKKGFKSTVLSLAWCPNNKFIVTGCTDFKARIHSAYIKGLDDPEDDGFGEIFADQHEFGACLHTFSQARAWINNVAWSPSGFQIAFAGQGSTLHVCQVGGDMVVQDVECKGLPFLDIKFMNDDTLVCGGFSMNPAIFHKGDDDAWAFAGNVDQETKGGGEEKKKSKRAAFNKFQGMSKRGEEKKSTKAFNTIHQNAITSIGVDPRVPSKFMSTGLDGRLLFWNLASSKDTNLKAIGQSM